MGKQPGPSPEELEFIFECFTRGLSDNEVLGEMQDTEFPVRNPRFIRDRRKGFNAARNVLEITLKQQANPALVKAKEEHLNRMHEFIKNMRRYIKPVGPYEDYLLEESKFFYSRNDQNSLGSIIDKDFVTFIDGDFAAFFLDCVKEHLPSPKLWQDIDEILSKYLKYSTDCENLVEEIKKEGKGWPVEIEEDFERPLIHNVNREEWEEENPGEEYVKVKWKSEGNRLIAEFGFGSHHKKPWDILSTENPLDYIDKYKEMSTRFMNSNTVADLISQHREFNSLIQQASLTLDKILARRDYFLYTCHLCPGQAK